jgi:hypothetical protein
VSSPSRETPSEGGRPESRDVPSTAVDDRWGTRERSYRLIGRERVERDTRRTRPRPLRSSGRRIGSGSNESGRVRRVRSPTGAG